MDSVVERSGVKYFRWVLFITKTCHVNEPFRLYEAKL